LSTNVRKYSDRTSDTQGGDTQSEWRWDQRRLSEEERKKVREWERAERKGSEGGGGDERE